MAKDNGGGFFAGFMLGGLIGAALALLFAPQPGQETQSMLREKGIELKGKLEEMSPEEAKSAIKQALKEAIEEGKLAATRTKEEMLDKLEHMKADLPDQESPAEEIKLA